ncbi:serine hydrolase domain-containing protein [Paenibacillus dakarensis]|uniref:serine hydrolase domain-containing protein n=1 Tax=Paenibacillus dakarensis TaxID=1527293 RepID=UPI0006D58D4F|nr:serine hydrolase domain-containing protein [Paenibacillus dakarensis]
MSGNSISFERIFQTVQQYVQDKKWPSAVFGVTNKDRILDVRSFGPDPNGKSVDSSTIYPVFSITKPMIGLCIMQLWEQGLVHPGQLITDIIPEFHEHGKDKLRLWHLLTHTSGLDQSHAAAWAQGKGEPDGMTHPKMFAALKNSQLQGTPGTIVNYNNMAFTLLAEIIERVTGESYDSYLQSHVFEPLGMKDTNFGGPALDQNRLAYVAGAEAMGAQMDLLMEAKLPSGGLFSTADDLLKFARVMMNESRYDQDRRLIQPLTFKQMITPQTLHLEDVDSDYGFVWKMPVRHKGYIVRNIYGHNGMGGCMMWVYPEQEVAFVLMTAQLAPGVDNIHIHNVFSSCFNS